MKPLFLLMIILPLNTAAQWIENFSDGNFIVNPAWFGDTTKFIINPSLQLQLNAPAEAGSAYLSTSSKISYKATWTFLVRMNFNPSSKNYAIVYLTSSNIDLTAPLYGYFLRIGGVNDDLCLFRQEGQDETLVADGRNKIFNTSQVNARIKVTRDDTGNWAVYCDSTGGRNFTLSAQGTDNTISQSAYFGVQCIYTKKNSTKFYFDDFEVTGKVYNDSSKLFLESFKVLDEKRLLVSFSKQVDTMSSFNASNLNLENNNLTRVDFNSITARSVVLTFNDAFMCGNDNLLQIKRIKDIWGLAMKDTAISFQYCTPKMFDVVFNEIMTNPIPTQGLPEAEYLELYNRSKKSLDLTGWGLFIGSKTYIFPEVQLSADSFLIITSKTNESKFSSFGKTLGLFTSSSTLNNTGQFLRLENSTGQLIAWLEYDDSWYADEFRAGGGWSLEQIDPLNACGGKANWTASKARAGGTPGSKNSVYNENPDITEPYIYHIHVPVDTLVDIYFNEPVDSAWATKFNSYEILPGIGHPKQTVVTDRHFLSVRLFLPHPLEQGQTYSLTVERDIADCAGNKLSQESSIPLAIPVISDSSDMVINEVLFNAKVGGSDYVELYNRSGKMLNARKILLGVKVNGKAENLIRLSETGFLIYPSSYLVVTDNIEQVKPFYKIENEKNFIELSQMHSLDDHASTIVLLNDTMGMIDEFSYSEKMHLSTLKNLEGISLERVNTDKPSNFPGNWHSAAETAGYGTPGYKNSQYLADTVTSQAISIDNEIFSPDNDGYKDILQVSYQFDKPGCRAQVYIFDAMGRLVRRLLNNESLGAQGSFAWDGTDDAGTLCTVGMYVVFVRTVFDDGTVKEYKKSCVLAVRR